MPSASYKSEGRKKPDGKVEKPAAAKPAAAKTPAANVKKKKRRAIA